MLPIGLACVQKLAAEEICGWELTRTKNQRIYLKIEKWRSSKITPKSKSLFLLNNSAFLLTECEEYTLYVEIKHDITLW